MLNKVQQMSADTDTVAEQLRTESLKQHWTNVQKDQFALHSWNVIFQSVCNDRTGEIVNLPLWTVRLIFRRFFEAYPTCGQMYSLYVDVELKANATDFEQSVQEVLGPALRDFCSFELYMAYIKFVKHRLGVTSSQSYATMTAEDTATLTNAFKYAVERVGNHLRAQPLWTDYLTMLTSVPVPSGDDAIDCTTKIRREFTRALNCPILDLRRVLEQYIDWERAEMPRHYENIDSAVVETVTGERRKAAEAAQDAARERMRRYQQIRVPRHAVHPARAAEGQRKAQQWAHLLRFERIAKTRTEHKGPAIRHFRVVFTYEQAVLHLYRHPEVWLQYAEYLQSADIVEATDAQRVAATVSVFNRAMVACPACHLLHFAAADYLERHGEVSRADAVYKGLVDQGDVLATIECLKALARRNIKAAVAFFEEMTGDSSTAPQDVQDSLKLAMERIYHAQGVADAAPPAMKVTPPAEAGHLGRLDGAALRHVFGELMPTDRPVMDRLAQIEPRGTPFGMPVVNHRGLNAGRRCAVNLVGMTRLAPNGQLITTAGAFRSLTSVVSAPAPVPASTDPTIIRLLAMLPMDVRGMTDRRRDDVARQTCATIMEGFELDKVFVPRRPAPDKKKTAARPVPGRRAGRRGHFVGKCLDSM